MTETTNETITIEKTVRIAASPETLWQFWTDPERLAEWWGSEAEVVTEPGGLFRVVMENGPVMRGTFAELEPPHRLVFTFGWEHNADGEALAPGSTRVEVTLTPDGSETVLVLRHLGMPNSHASDHDTGWSYFVGERLTAAAVRDNVAASGSDDLMPVDVSTEITIDRPVADVAEYATDPSNAPSWYANIESVEWVTPPPVHVGSRVKFVARFLGRRLVYTYEFVELERGDRLVMRTAEGPFPMETTYTWSTAGEGKTRMTLRNRGEPSGFSKVMAPFMSGAMRRANREDLARLRSILEAS